MLTTGTHLLDVANKHSFAVPAFNISDWAMSQGIFEISEEKGAPLIIGIHPDELAHTGPELLPAIRHRAHRSSVPVAIHLDHGTTYEHILQAIQSGFTSVMFDGSMLPFEENMALTKRAAEAAHAVGLSVEGELGTIGKTTARPRTAPPPSSIPTPTMPCCSSGRQAWTASRSRSAPATASTPHG